MNDAIKTRTAVVESIPDNIDETRTFTFVARGKEVDNHRTVFNHDNWKLDRFNNNPIIGYQHQVYGSDMCVKADPDDVIGKGRAYIEGGVLMCQITLEPEGDNPTADKIFKKLKFGSLRAVSVGILPFGQGAFGEGEERQGGTDQKYYFDGQELLEISVVNIPSDADSLKTAQRNWSSNALRHIRTFLGDSVDIDQIRSMTVGEVINSLSENENHVFAIDKNKNEAEPAAPLHIPSTGTDVLRDFEIFKLKNQ